MGLELKNPLIVSSSGLTNSLRKLKLIEEKGAGALVLKSLFEEQINNEAQHVIDKDESNVAYPEAQDYIHNYVKSNNLGTYLDLIREAKENINIPVIASINCISSNDWVQFAKDIESAGADALELNIFVMPSSKNLNSNEFERLYLEIFTKVKEQVSIPVSVKLGSYFTNIINMANQLAVRGVNSLVLFNKYFEPDIDIDKLCLTTSDVFTSPKEIKKSLKWVGLLSAMIKDCDISSSTGVYDAEGMIKMILAGAKTVQICSTVYENGFDVIEEILENLQTWMKKKNFNSIDEFRAILNYDQIKDPFLYERAQFMKHFSNNEKNAIV
jgi:dihydroorotate dehydrogenase (fumarate)